MDAQTTNLLARVESRTRQLLMEHQRLQQELKLMHQQVFQQEEEIRFLGKEKEELQQKYDRLRMAKYIDMADDDTKDIRGRIKKMVRDIDRCIALLKTE